MRNTGSDVLIERLKLLHQWEQSHLPTYGSQAGYQLFLELASIPADSGRTLKQVYLSLPCAHSTTRLLFRKLESDGWVTIARTGSDQRLRTFQRTEKFQALVWQWLGFAAQVLDATLLDVTHAARKEGLE